AWAEIEHEVCYKSGVTYPDLILRRFGALAGTLELLENQFLVLRSERDHLIDAYREAYKQGKALGEELDTARLLAYLEMARPLGFGWRMAAREARPFRPGLERVCVEALQAANIRTARQLEHALALPKCKRILRSFASLMKVAPEEVSHFAVTV